MKNTTFLMTFFLVCILGNILAQEISKKKKRVSLLSFDLTPAYSKSLSEEKFPELSEKDKQAFDQKIGKIPTGLEVKTIKEGKWEFLTKKTFFLEQEDNTLKVYEKTPHDQFFGDLEKNTKSWEALESWLNEHKEEKDDDLDAFGLLLKAELLKRKGDLEAETYYESAISLNQEDAFFNTLYAEYLKTYRGAGNRPLISDSEEHFFSGKNKLGNKLPYEIEIDLDEKIERQLISLYEQDGIPLFFIEDDRPVLFFSSKNRFTRKLPEARDLISEANFASGETRINARLPLSELRKFVRTQELFELEERLRLRYKYYPTIDLSFKFLTEENANITNFFEPTNEFNSVDISTLNLGIFHTLNYKEFDLFMGLNYRFMQREGLIEFLPENKEAVNELEAKFGMARYLGPDRLSLDFVYVFDHIEQRVENPIQRNRHIIGATASYRLNRLSLSNFNKGFSNRGLIFFGGFLHDREKFDESLIKKMDYFGGITFSGDLNLPYFESFDFTFQSTLLQTKTSGEQGNHSEVSISATPLIRIWDEEKHPEIPQDFTIEPASIHLAFPTEQTISLNKGIYGEEFENIKTRVELQTKYYTKDRTSIFFNIGAGYQNFNHLHKDVFLFQIELDIGF